MDQGRAQLTTDLRAGVESTLAMFAHKVREKRITLERDYADSLPPVAAFGGELNQVWTNLLDNAIDAAPVGGRVGVRTSSAGRDVVVEISDDGPGVSDEIRDRIWDPFFTTKAVGEGTGLGLDIARRIVVRQHGGQIALDRAAGRTRFTVRLPTQPGPAFESTPIEQEGGM
jgi:signal transduction histidine kinase